ncbi:MAG: tryptophan--tRNA ligase [Asgard group archaeon]|mgnify:FL=1|jgi:tryptophanyl-tRNA synthetase|nr:tryptophan--tRNA ligase [Asgard group archaeon]|tara:strand:- start:182 stop:1324 length:1143 start_codon:yes stop_codon:yes gene_type:complete
MDNTNIENNFSVTPWEVKGNIDYSKLIKQFGTETIDEALLNRIKKHTGQLHHMLRRNIFFTHRDLNWLLDEYEKGNKFYLYTGRGPSGPVHLGHIVTWEFTKWLQSSFDVPLLFQITDDEKFLFSEKFKNLSETKTIAYDNILDIIAIGFDPKKTKIMIDSDNSKTLYNAAIPIAKKITFSTVKSSFGFTNSNNIGEIFYTAIQAVPSIIESIWQNKNIPCLIPHAIDQDPHFRVARDVLPKLGYYKPASIQNSFFPDLTGHDGKMSSSNADTAIYMSDTPKMVKSKINKYAFSGGQDTLELHRKLGGDPSVDISFQWLYQFFESDDNKIKKIEEDYISGELLSGELKAILIEKINQYLENHRNKKETLKDKIEDYLIKD